MGSDLEKTGGGRIERETIGSRTQSGRKAGWERRAPLHPREENLRPAVRGGRARRERERGGEERARAGTSARAQGRAPSGADKGAGGGARAGGRSRETVGQVRAGQRAEPRCRDGAQPGRAPGLGPEHQAEREPEPQPVPGPGRGLEPQGPAARSGDDGAPQRLRGFLQAPCRWPGVSKSPQPGSAGIPHQIQDPETPRKAGAPPRPTQNDSPAGEGEEFLRIQKIATFLWCREDSPSSIWAPPRARTQ